MIHYKGWILRPNLDINAINFNTNTEVNKIQ